MGRGPSASAVQRQPKRRAAARQGCHGLQKHQHEPAQGVPGLGGPVGVAQPLDEAVTQARGLQQVRQRVRGQRGRQALEEALLGFAQLMGIRGNSGNAQSATKSVKPGARK